MKDRLVKPTIDLAVLRKARRNLARLGDTGGLHRRQFVQILGVAAGGAALAGVLGAFGRRAGAATPATGAAAAAGAKVPAARPVLAKSDRVVRTGQFVFPRLQFSVNDETTDIWNVSPIGDVNLRRKLAELTNINVSQDPRVVRLGDFDDLCRNPFVFMTSEGSFKLTEIEEKNLKEFLERGGFIMADDCVFNGKEDRFFRCYRDLIDKLFPESPMRKIPLDHELFHCYFDLPNGAPHCQGVAHGAWGLFEPGTGRLMTVVTPGDIHCGWCYRWFSKEKNDASIQMGINEIIYFLTH